MPDDTARRAGQRRRLALGVAYRGGAYHGWQSQPDGRTVQDRLERALSAVRRRAGGDRVRRAAPTPACTG